MAGPENKPVLSGLVALVAVAVVVGLLAGVGALALTRMTGLTSASVSGGGGNEPQAGDTLYLPDPSITPGDEGPLVTLLPTDDDETSTDEPTEESEEPRKKRKKKEKEKPQIVLSAGQRSVSAMERIDLTGVYPGGEGAILQVQRFEGGTWTDFYSVNANVSNETFTTYIETSRSGVNRFRVVDPATGRASNEVRITVG